MKWVYYLLVLLLGLCLQPWGHVYGQTLPPLVTGEAFITRWELTQGVEYSIPFDGRFRYKWSRLKAGGGDGGGDAPRAGGNGIQRRCGIHPDG